MPLARPHPAPPANCRDAAGPAAPDAPAPPDVGEPLDAALRDAVREVVRLHERAALEPPVADPPRRVAGRAPDGAAPPPRIATSRERRWAEAHDVARTALDRDVAAYARGARGAGVPITAVLESVAVAVRAAAATMALGPRDALVRDAGRWCTKGYYER